MTKYKPVELVPSRQSAAVPVEYRNEGSNLLNYGDYYDEFDDLPEVECHSCRGTGLDKYEEFDCPDCQGEGFVPEIPSYVSDSPLDTTPFPG